VVFVHIVGYKAHERVRERSCALVAVGQQLEY